MAVAMSHNALVHLDHAIIKIEDSPEPTPLLMSPTEHHSSPSASSNAMSQPVDPKDPEGFLRRCSGYNKKKNVRCSAIIGRNSHHFKNSHSTYLPTCYTHKDQQSFAGWCQFTEENGERCGTLFRWTPPYLELCAQHQGHPDTPCYFLKLPLELRLEIFRYLLPSRAIGSSTSVLHIDEDAEQQQQQPWYNILGGPPGSGRPLPLSRPSSPLDRSTMRSVFPVPFITLLSISRQIHDEVKDILYSTVPFTVDVRKDGTFMCGRRLLEPRRADGSSHYVVGDVDRIKERFLKTFDWAAVKNYNVDILVENWKDDTNRGYHTFPWDEEVEIYDIRDYIGVVISGILSKARNLCRLNVRLGFSKFVWTEEETYTNIKTLVGPFERLRNVRQPRLLGVYEGTPQTNFIISLPMPSKAGTFSTLMNGVPHGRPSTPLCSVPQLPTKEPFFFCTQPAFAEYRRSWERSISSASATSLVSKPPIRAMFTELKEFYTRLAATVPDVTARNGRHAFLHRARVAREQENVEAFRHLRNELIGYWEAYLEQEERKKHDMNRRLSRMLDVDVYPASWDEDHACVVTSGYGASSTPSSSSSQSPIITDADSWLNARKRSQPELVQSAPAAPSNSDSAQHRAHSRTSGSSSRSGGAPLIIDLSQDEPPLERPRTDATRPWNVKANEKEKTVSPHLSQATTPTLSPTTSDPTKSPQAIFQSAALQQQPMALNPQLYLEATMSHRGQVELQTRRAQMQAAQHRAQQQAQLLAQQLQQQAQQLAQQEVQRMTPGQLQQRMAQIQAETQRRLNMGASSGLGLAPRVESTGAAAAAAATTLMMATMPTPNGTLPPSVRPVMSSERPVMAYGTPNLMNQMRPSSSSLSYAALNSNIPFDHVTIPNVWSETDADAMESPLLSNKNNNNNNNGNKRGAAQIEEGGDSYDDDDDDDGGGGSKRRRVDSGMGCWSDEEAGDDGGEPVTGGGDHHHHHRRRRHHRHHHQGFEAQNWEFEGRSGGEWVVGKGKARAVEAEGVWTELR